MNKLLIRDDKIKGSLKLAFLSDIHYGTIQPSYVFSQTIDRINKEDYDYVLIAGDICDKNTSHDSLINLFKELKRLNAKKGIYFVYGNHDLETSSKSKHSYNDDEFKELIDNASIKVIDDKIIDLEHNIELIGRRDYSFNDRLDINDLLKDVSESKYKILMVHQPIELDEISKRKVDLSLCGHYHGAQNWPNNIIYFLSDIKYNGKYKMNEMTIYVNAGIAGSKYKFRTHGHCEYVQIILEGENK